MAALRGPQLLKDYLASDSHSCSSSGFRSFPRHQRRHSTETIRNLLEIDLNPTRSQIRSPAKLTRSRSRAASAVHRASEIFSNAVVKFLPALHKSRRGEFSREGGGIRKAASATVKVKDILRWRSSRDLVEEQQPPPPPLDFFSSSSPLRPATPTGSTSSSNTSGTSWCDSDFTAEELPSWYGNGEFLEGKRFSPEEGVGGDSDLTIDPTAELSCEETEQHSPVSVLNFPIQEDEQSFLPFHHCLENLESNTKPTNLKDQFYLDEGYVDCKEYYGEGDAIEEKARQMLNLNHITCADASVDRLLLDFFRDELATSRKQNDARFEREILRVAEDWVSGKYEESFKWEMEGKREAFVREMERGERWRKFDEEREDLAMEMEAWVLDYLVDELLVDLS
ncbi:hypothetical protein Vadar_031721 [Vaccinium darrowii]|uniref:Uncharacterized protein n=1 Tax=Vaccinium darrowii TaxID=229202 RepID=A0ACB7Y9W7_9ERIC|nr:hypothetical protein Vadar_031721 [Vaccinium darrowii]